MDHRILVIAISEEVLRDIQIGLLLWICAMDCGKYDLGLPPLLKTIILSSAVSLEVLVILCTIIV